MPLWADIYKIYQYAFQQDPLFRKRTRGGQGTGHTNPDFMPDLRGGEWGSGAGGGMVRIRDSSDFIDLSAITNRLSRYKEYERLRNIPEIETAMNVFADEACIAGCTPIATVYEGFKTIDWLEQNYKNREFAVYCWDFDKNDYTIGWAYDPRIVKTAETLRISLDDGSYIIVTPDHRVLRSDEDWAHAGDLNVGEHLMPFYKMAPNLNISGSKINQFDRIYTFQDGWKNERQFIDEWMSGQTKPKDEKVYQALRMLSGGLTTRQVADKMGHQWNSIDSWIRKAGFSTKEIANLNKKFKPFRKIIGIQKWKTMDVYDLSVKKHANFCTNTGVLHNCQKNDEGDVVNIECSNESVASELNYLFLDRKMLNLNKTLWGICKETYIRGDYFMETILDPEEPKLGITGIQPLPAESMFRIETTKGKLIEFQQSKEGPDYQALGKVDVAKATESELNQATALRFRPEQIIHIKIGDDRKTFYPYGVSLIEPARGPAHQLRLMEDAMLVYRLTRAPERRVFYIDVGDLPPYKAEAFMDRMKDQFRKKKVGQNRGGLGANAVEEKWHAPAADEDYWVPIRKNQNTRIETLPGAQNLGEIDDAVYFRNKLLTALNFPKNYFSQEDPNATRITLSAQDIKFARMIERLQHPVEEALLEIAERHLHLLGYPEESYQDLEIKMTPPSDWRELSRAEVKTNRMNNANSMKTTQLMSDYDILTKELKYSDDEAREMISRMKIQKLEDLKLQIMAQNPALLGIGLPGQDGGENQIGMEPGGPNQMPPPEGGQGQPPGANQPQQGGEATGGIGQEEEGPPQGGPPQGGKEGAPLPEPTEDDIKKYDLAIQDYPTEQDEEDIDYSLEDNF